MKNIEKGKVFESKILKVPTIFKPKSNRKKVNEIIKIIDEFNTKYDGADKSLARQQALYAIEKIGKIVKDRVV